MRTRDSVIVEEVLNKSEKIFQSVEEAHSELVTLLEKKNF